MATGASQRIAGLVIAVALTFGCSATFTVGRSHPMATGASQIFVEQVREAAAILGLVAPVAKAYMLASMDDQSANLNNGDHVEFDSDEVNDGSGAIVLATGAGQLGGLITLEAGRVYEITASLVVSYGSVSGFLRYIWHDNTANADFGIRGGQRSTTFGTDEFSPGIATAIFAPAVDSEIELRIDGEFQPTTIRGLGAAQGTSFVKVVEIG